jgi:hypothetical protein
MIAASGERFVSKEHDESSLTDVPLIIKFLSLVIRQPRDMVDSFSVTAPLLLCYELVTEILSVTSPALTATAL